MRHREQMKAIKQQKQKEDSSLNSLQSESEIEANDIIQEYDNLDFSDEMSRMEKDDHSSDEAELSLDKLTYLGVDKFPGPYAQKLRDISDTRIGESANVYNRTSKQDAEWPGNRRNSKPRNHQISNQSFNINSFLNSRPSHDRSNEREKHNTNGFGKILRDHESSRSSFSSQQHQDTRQKRYRDEEKIKKIRDFVMSYNTKNRSKQPKSSDQSYMSNESITLITLPEPERSWRQEEKKKGEQFVDGGKIEATQLQQIRFEQAKINFIDSFLPESMKIGSNPYKFLKYMNSKPKGFERML